ncbi:MAG TPA: M20/M25/M40 family metallo-hydrolase [Candidatus Acidoferrales bacterium]|nr:M20/M25/M40 family metallo-hydrolase [Candidatus Acidoferrales bacterium]
MKQRRLVLVMFVVLLGLVGWRGLAQETQRADDPMVAVDRKIFAEVKDNNELLANLEYLTDMIGPRLTGTERLLRANYWTMEMFRKYGLSDVHMEPWTIAHAWYRGTARGRIVSPAEHVLTLHSAGWSPGTPGAMRGRVVYVAAQREADLEAYRGKLKGAVVITAEPGILPGPYDVPVLPVLRPMPRRPTPAEVAAVTTDIGEQRFSRARSDFFRREGVAAVLFDSDKDFGLLNMRGIGGREYNVGAVPSGFITAENYRLIWRLLKRGPVEVELEITNSFSDKPIKVYNTVAEIPGSEKPEEVVILGAHLDSWDLGTGATDNGTGSMAVLEAARALQKLSPRPKRTIRFILFSGEEQGLNGSRAYVKAHEAELAKISGVFVHDSGTGRVLTIGLQNNYQDREVMERIVAPLSEVGLFELSLRSGFGTDHASFNAAGVPGFYCLQDPATYPRTHHSQADTFDRVQKDDLTQGAQVLAAWAYNVAQWAEMLPRTLAPAAGAARSGGEE